MIEYLEEKINDSSSSNDTLLFSAGFFWQVSQFEEALFTTPTDMQTKDFHLLFCFGYFFMLAIVMTVGREGRTSAYA